MVEPKDFGAGSQTYLVFGREDGRPHTVCGEDNAKPPIVDEGDVLFWRIHADSWEEAMKLYHQLQGWEPYNPME